MAVTKIYTWNERLSRLIRYIRNASKTKEESLVSALNCTPENAVRQMRKTKERYDQSDGVQVYHIIQSFRPGEVTPELAHMIGEELAYRYLPGYEVVIGTHIDKDHIHNHLAFNSVCRNTGSKYHSTPGSYYNGIRRISDELCRENGLSVITKPCGIKSSRFEWELHNAGLLTYREMVDQDITECINLALDIGNFYELMEYRGYVIRHQSRYPSFQPDGAKVPLRAKQNGKSLTEDDLSALIDKSLEIGTPEIIVPRHCPAFQHPGRLHGFRALYTHWMYVLGIIGNSGHVPYKNVGCREIRRFKQYKKQQAFLDRTGIDTRSELNAKRESVTREIENLTKTRAVLKRRKKRNRRMYEAAGTIGDLSDIPRLYLENPSGFEKEYARYRKAEKLLEGRGKAALQKERDELQAQISDINMELKKLRSELYLCEMIAHDEPAIEQKLEVNLLREEPGHENCADHRLQER